MNFFGKTLFNLTALAPGALVLAAVCFTNGLASDTREQYWLAGGLVLCVALLSLLFYYVVWHFLTKHNDSIPLNTTKIKSADKETVAFVLAYVLPLFAKEAIKTPENWIPLGVTVLIMAVIFFQTTACTFNPVLAMFGYHFYEVEADSVTYILITKKKLSSPRNSLRICQIHDLVYFEARQPPHVKPKPTRSRSESHAGAS